MSENVDTLRIDILKTFRKARHRGMLVLIGMLILCAVVISLPMIRPMLPLWVEAIAITIVAAFAIFKVIPAYAYHATLRLYGTNALEKRGLNSIEMLENASDQK